MTALHITPPNTCALIVSGTQISYLEAPPTADIWPADGYTSFNEYLTPEDALAAALVIDPAYDGAIILGAMPVTVDTETGAGQYLYGDTINLEYVVSSTVPHTVSYQWYEDGLMIPGETSSTLSPGKASFSTAGSYRCDATITATDGSNRTVSLSGEFDVTTTPVAGDFTLTRSGNNITTGLFSYFRGFAATTATLVVPATGLTISYDPVDGFKTTGDPLSALDQVAEIFINGEFVRSVTIHAVDGTFNYNFSA